MTIDFITPVVDDPKRFGEIAAANSLSDVYAMGGRPIIALNVVCFPTSCEPISVLQDILEGGARKVIEARTMLAGGHSVQDEEPKYGLVVFGEVSSEQILPLVREMFEFVRGFEGDIPGAAPEECGNYLDQNLPMAKWLAARYLERDLANIDESHLTYPTGE